MVFLILQSGLNFVFVERKLMKLKLMLNNYPRTKLNGKNNQTLLFNNNSGFSLTEILIAFGLMGILALVTSSLLTQMSDVYGKTNLNSKVENAIAETKNLFKNANFTQQSFSTAVNDCSGVYPVYVGTSAATGTNINIGTVCDGSKLGILVSNPDGVTTHPLVRENGLYIDQISLTVLSPAIPSKKNTTTNVIEYYSYLMRLNVPIRSHPQYISATPTKSLYFQARVPATGPDAGKIVQITSIINNESCPSYGLSTSASGSDQCMTPSGDRPMASPASSLSANCFMRGSFNYAFSNSTTPKGKLNLRQYPSIQCCKKGKRGGAKIKC